MMRILFVYIYIYIYIIIYMYIYIYVYIHIYVVGSCGIQLTNTIVHRKAKQLIGGIERSHRRNPT